MKAKIIINILVYASLLLIIACGPGIKQSELQGTKNLTCQCKRSIGGKGLRFGVTVGPITIKSSDLRRAGSLCKQKYSNKYGINRKAQTFFVKGCR